MSDLSPTALSILACARSLVVKGGYHGFSYADISAVVGIRNASIHHHFPSKADLVRVLVVQYREETIAGLEALSRAVPEPRVQLASYVGYWQRCIADASRPYCVCAMLAAEIDVLPEPVALEVRAYFRSLALWLEGVLGQGVAAGQFALSGAPEKEAQVVMATVHGAMLSARAYGDPDLFRIITQPLLDRLAG